LLILSRPVIQGVQGKDRIVPREWFRFRADPKRWIAVTAPHWGWRRPWRAALAASAEHHAHEYREDIAAEGGVEGQLVAQ
jgi:hypothetical protein